MSAGESLDPNATVYVAGHKGLVGSAIWRRLEGDGFTKLVGLSSDELDLRERDSVFNFFKDVRPSITIVAAAHVGGILANATKPADFLSDNLRIQINVMDAAAHFGVERLLFLGSSCIYPRDAPQPLKEEYLLTGPLEPTNYAYAIAKIAGIMQVQALRLQHGVRYISAMPTNLYGPNDNFDLETSHVMPAMIRKFYEAKNRGASEVVLWGSGEPRREFLHVDDLARAGLMLLERYDEPETINVGTGEDITVRELAEAVAEVVGFTGELVWDSSKPDGTPRKLLDVSRILELGWKPEIPLTDGIKSTYDWYRASAHA